MSKRQSRKSRLSEDAGSARIVRKTIAAIAAGQEILLPKTVVDRLAARKRPYQVSRKRSGHV